MKQLLKNLPRTNALAYSAVASSTKKKKFYKFVSRSSRRRSRTRKSSQVRFLSCVYASDFTVHICCVAGDCDLERFLFKRDWRHNTFFLIRGKGKLTWTFSAQHRRISAPRLVSTPPRLLALGGSGNPHTFSGKWLHWFTRTPWLVRPGNPYWRERLSTVDLLVLTSLDQQLLYWKHFLPILQNKLP